MDDKAPTPQEEINGPVMLCATNILKRPEIRVGHIYGNVSLPRPVRLSVLLSGGIGALLGLSVGSVLGGYHGAIYGAIFLGGLGVGLVTYSPLKGESFLTWLGLTLKHRRKEVSIDGRAVRLAVGICPLSAPLRGHAYLRPGVVQVDPSRWDDRGVLRSAANHNLDTPSFRTAAQSPAAAEQDPMPRATVGSKWTRSDAEDKMVVYPSPEQAAIASVLAERETQIKLVVFGEDPPQLLAPEDRLATKVALAQRMGVRVDQIVLGDAGLPGILIPLPPAADGRPQLVEAKTHSQTRELARDAVNYASGVTAAWLSRRVHESEDDWARRLFHFKVEVGALDCASGREVDWLKVAGIDVDSADGSDELDKALGDKPGRLDSVTIELTAHQMASIDAGVQVLNARDAILREQLRADARAARNTMLEDAEARVEAGGREFSQALRELRETATGLLGTLGSQKVPAVASDDARARLSAQADRLRIAREGVLVAAAELGHAYRIVEATETENYEELDRIGQEVAETIEVIQARANQDELRQQQTLAPLFTNNRSHQEIERLDTQLQAFFVEQTQFAATTVADARAVRDRCLESLTRARHRQDAASARTLRGAAPARIADIVGGERPPSFPELPTGS